MQNNHRQSQPSSASAWIVLSLLLSLTSCAKPPAVVMQTAPIQKQCPALVLYSPASMPPFTGNTWIDLASYTKVLQAEYSKLLADRQAIAEFCSGR